MHHIIYVIKIFIIPITNFKFYVYLLKFITLFQKYKEKDIYEINIRNDHRTLDFSYLTVIIVKKLFFVKSRYFKSTIQSIDCI